VLGGYTKVSGRGALKANMEKDLIHLQCGVKLGVGTHDDDS